jgi:hypothetical protein
MAKWEYTITSGKALREAIYNEDTEQVVKCLIHCYKELQSKLTEEDKEWKGYDIEDSIGVLTLYALYPDDEDNVNYYLEEFYDICDDVRAWIEI